MRQQIKESSEAVKALSTLVYLTIVLSGLLLGLFIVVFGSCAWLLKDGFGPNSIKTSGFEAVVSGFWCLGFGPISAGMILIYCAVVFAKLRSVRLRSMP